jgi:uncharacterized membrane protein
MTGRILFAGVILSAALLTFGLAIDLVHPLHSGALRHSQILDLPAGIVHADAAAFIHLGVLVLMSTPLLRVVVLAFEFGRDHEWAFVAITLGVLFLLIVSFVLGAIE